ncbi:hypothetical protein HMPREF9413_4309 [Paenibacillus sp. HGF7]|nr:hypothetical protein HMPREF9413_4309 [Paenibacillus sp. HGF7]
MLQSRPEGRLIFVGRRQPSGYLTVLILITGSAHCKTFLFCTKKFSLLSIAQEKDVA